MQQAWVAAQHAAALREIAQLRQQNALLQQLLEAEEQEHDDTRAHLAAVVARADGFAARAQQDLANIRKCVMQKQRAQNKAAAAVCQELIRSSTHLQQQRQAAAAAQHQARFSGFACVRLEAQLRTTQQLQRTLEQQLEQARSEREQAATAGRALREQLQQANSATFTAQQALAAERVQHSAAMAQQAAQQQAADCFVQVTLVPSHGSKPSSSQAAANRACTAVSSGGQLVFEAGLTVFATVGSLVRGVLCSSWV
jgi:chromosome segregation ATPase